MFKFLLFEPIHEAGLKVLQEAGEVRMASGTDEDTLIAEIGDIDGAVVRAQGALTRRVMENAPKLKVAGRHGVGVDNIDVAAATELGIQIVNTPMAVVEGVAEHTVGLMLSLSKGMSYGERMLRQGDWSVRYRLQGRELRGRTVGIVGFGRIGRRIAEILYHAFGMQILYHDVVRAPEEEAALGARLVSLEELLGAAEYVTVHVPLLPSTLGMFNQQAFAMMRPDAFFFNTSRGQVVDEQALYDALTSGQIAGAAIDVFVQEPTPADNPLLQLDNILVTPHMCTATEEALVEMALVTEDIVRVLKGEQPKYPVNRLD
jgi:D-3-phosphoglycerate dehydrogenase / 2-oxoglutarate reductase